MKLIYFSFFELVDLFDGLTDPAGLHEVLVNLNYESELSDFPFDPLPNLIGEFFDHDGFTVDHEKNRKVPRYDLDRFLQKTEKPQTVGVFRTYIEQFNPDDMDDKSIREEWDILRKNFYQALILVEKMGGCLVDVQVRMILD